MQAALFLFTVSTLSSGTGVFMPDSLLWAGIDALNSRLSVPGYIESDTLEMLFEDALELAFSPEFSDQFEDLRTDSYTFGYDSARETCIGRAEPAITVLPMGESDNIGLNIASFLRKSEPGSRAHIFFSLASDGFYVDGETHQPGTAILPVWMERGCSSAEAVVVPEAARRSLVLWEAMRYGPDGAFVRIADETAEGLSSQQTP